MAGHTRHRWYADVHDEKVTRASSKSGIGVCRAVHETKANNGIAAVDGSSGGSADDTSLASTLRS